MEFLKSMDALHSNTSIASAAAICGRKCTYCLARFYSARNIEPVYNLKYNSILRITSN